MWTLQLDVYLGQLGESVASFGPWQGRMILVSGLDCCCIPHMESLQSCHDRQALAMHQKIQPLACSLRRAHDLASLN